MRWTATIDRRASDFFIEHRNPTQVRQDPGKDVFFAPLAFEDRRTNEEARGFTILFADMDNVRQHKSQLDLFWPHILWMTSNENAQAVWFLRSEEPTLSAWSDLNQRMTYFMGADKGGWHASKLLRVPGSDNYKYDPPQTGAVVSFQPKAAPYEAEALREALPSLSKAPSSTSEAPVPFSKGEWKPHLAKIWSRLSLHTRADLLAPSMRDRSEALVRASNKMRHAGISPEDQFQALWWADWNKFRTDRHRPDMLWSIVNYE